MERRTFLQALSALVVAPAVPSIATAAPSAAALEHFKVAKLITRAHNNCSQEMLMRLMRVDRSMAAELQSLLLQRGVITTPVAGVSMATNPMNTHCIPIEAMKPTNLAQSVEAVRAQVAKLNELRQKASATLERVAGEMPEDDDPEDGTAPA